MPVRDPLASKRRVPAPPGYRWATGGGAMQGECNAYHLSRGPRGTICGQYGPHTPPDPPEGQAICGSCARIAKVPKVVTPTRTARALATYERVLNALRSLEDGTADPGQRFDWDLDCAHGFAARQVAYAMEGNVHWKPVFAVLEDMADRGMVLRVKLDRSHRRAPTAWWDKPDEIVPVYRTRGA